MKPINITTAEITSVLEFIEDLRAETDRAAVILSASKLDILLGQILHRYLLPCTTAKDDLLEDGPLSSFNAKIDMVCRLGLIDGICARSIHLIRKIRNDFAHELSEGTLNKGAHRDRIKLLSTQFNNYAPYLAMRDYYLKGKEGTPSENFRIIASILPVHLTIILNTLVPITPLDIPLSIFTAAKKQEVTAEANKQP